MVPRTIISLLPILKAARGRWPAPCPELLTKLTQADELRLKPVLKNRCPAIRDVFVKFSGEPSDFEMKMKLTMQDRGHPAAQGPRPVARSRTYSIGSQLRLVEKGNMAVDMYLREPIPAGIDATLRELVGGIRETPSSVVVVSNNTMILSVALSSAAAAGGGGGGGGGATTNAATTDYTIVGVRFEDSEGKPVCKYEAKV
ncbi:hypothetical protein FOL46_005534 [Perkinsus olseni]|uniref:Uncharacterized protein n=1 Tax=Perkinsus olseni TaxID=32597 RepID=A0A7J6LRP7_PEROL|nr:hypothetical protein FOL46_005534 [Perkinsus olseni]